jgi:HlyD family secretion protein
VAVALVVASLVVGRGSSADAGYRTATVASRPVDQTLDRVGTIEPVSQASVSFPVSGTVATVDVAVGDQVGVGQHLAQLDTTSLDSAVADAQAALDQAELTLERALNGESVSSGLTGSPTAAPASASAGSGAFVVTPVAVTTTTQADAELSAAQQAVLSAQQQVDTDLAAAQQALDDAQAVCAAVASPSTTDTTASTVPDDDVSACQDALAGVLDAQHVVAASQSALADASRALDQLLSDRAAATGSSTTTTPGAGSPTSPQSGPSGGTGSPSSPQSAPGGGTGGGTGGGAAVGGSSSPTSAELVAYQKAVDAAAAEVAVAEQAAAQASLVSPITGTVQQVDLAVGDSVSPGSSAAAVVIVGSGGYEVPTTVTVDDLPDLDLGQAVTILADGTDEPVEGEVVGIGTVGSSSGSATTYPVTVALTDQPDGFRNGTTASLSIVTARTADAVAVPTSAVTVEGGRATVTVLDDGKPSEVTVQTGAVGEVWTEITDGLDVGQTVVLADLDAPLPTSATDTQTTGGFGGPGGGFGGFGGGLSARG